MGRTLSRLQQKVTVKRPCPSACRLPAQYTSPPRQPSPASGEETSTGIKLQGALENQKKKKIPTCQNPQNWTPRHAPQTSSAYIGQ